MHNRTVWFRGVYFSILGMAISLGACLSASSAEDATALRVTNNAVDSVAVFLVDLETSNRSNISFEARPLRLSIANRGVIAPGSSREFPFDSILNYQRDRAIRVEVLRVKNDTAAGNTFFDFSSDDLKRSGYSISVGLR